MSASIKTLLVLGGTSGIGEAFARRWHSQGKRVIITGRRQARLDALKAELTDIEVYNMDVSDFPELSKHVEYLMAAYGPIDSVWVNAAVTNMNSFVDKSSTSDKMIMDEIASNVTAPTLLARYIVPHLIAQNAEANFIVTSSGTGFVPVGMMAVYCSSKAYVHSFMVALRQQLADTNVNVIEIVPPLVNTGMGQDNETAQQKFHMMSLKDFTDEMFDILDNNQAKDLKEVSVGTGAARVSAWRSAIDPLLESMKLGG